MDLHFRIGACKNGNNSAFNGFYSDVMVYYSKDEGKVFIDTDEKFDALRSSRSLPNNI